MKERSATEDTSRSSWKSIRIVLEKYLLATVGMFFVALGIALSIISNLGTAPLSCPAYVLNLRWAGISVGTFTWLVNLFYVFIQLAVLRRRFKAKYLMQIVASIIFGALIDVSMWIFSWMSPVTLAARLGIAVAGCLVTAFGISLEVVARGWMLSAEMTVYAIVKAHGTDFGRTKVEMDSLVVLSSAALCFLFFGNPFGAFSAGALSVAGGAGWWDFAREVLFASSGESVIGFGTLLSALSVGFLMKVTDPLVDRFMNRFIIKDPERGDTQHFQ